MSTLVAQLDAELLTAIKERDDFARDTLRFLKSVLKNAEIDGGQALTDEQAVAIIQKEVKKRHEAVAAFTQAQKPELAAQETKEAEFLQKYLPAQKGSDELAAAIQAYLAANPTTPDQFGRAMGALSQQFKGQADLSELSKLLRQAIDAQ
jgi:uncharacterized protein YqeY